MYDSPKAVHFDAFFGGNLLKPDDPVGLKYRWIVADSVEKNITRCMLCATPDEIDQHIAEISSEFPVIVKRRT